MDSAVIDGEPSAAASATGAASPIAPMASTWAATGSSAAVMTDSGSGMRIFRLLISGNDGGTGAAGDIGTLSMTGAATAEMSGETGPSRSRQRAPLPGTTSAFGLVVRRGGAFLGAGLGSAGTSVAVSTPMVPFSAGAPDESDIVVWLVASVALPNVGSTSATAVAAVSETFFVNGKPAALAPAFRPRLIPRPLQSRFPQRTIDFLQGTPNFPAMHEN